MSPSISLAASNHPGPRRPLGLGPASPRGRLSMSSAAGGGTALPAGMQGEVAQRILEDLKAVERGHAVRAADDTLRRRVQAIKAYQQRRFENSYADLLAERRYAAAVGFPIAVAGTLGYMVGGVAGNDLPAGSFNYIYLPALAACVAASMLTAPFGAKAAHKLPVATLKKIFAGVILLLLARMVHGLFF